MTTGGRSCWARQRRRIPDDETYRSGRDGGRPLRRERGARRADAVAPADHQRAGRIVRPQFLGRGDGRAGERPCDPRRDRFGNERDQPHTRLCRSEEHTSELQSLMRISYAVFCLNKKKKVTTRTKIEQNKI